jgi:hypothetical protein
LRRELADVILKTKLKKIVLVADEIRYIFIGLLWSLKIISPPPPTSSAAQNQWKLLLCDIHITVDEINFLNSMK